MEITQAQARTMLFFMSVTDNETRLCSRDLAWAVELAKFAEMDAVAIANWQRRHDEEKEEEDYYDDPMPEE